MSIYVTQSSLPPFDEYVEEIKDIWDTHILTNMGPKHDKLADELKHYLGVNHLELLSNGHMALELSLQAMNLSGEVITTPFTFASTTHAIVRSGLTPVFCDINPYDFTIDATKIESLITDRTCAILPVHVYGNICDTSTIQEIANNYGLKVIYDAAHSFGISYMGKGIGVYGDVSCFSFHATKVFNTIEGGAVCFNDTEIGKKIYKLKNFGIKDEEIVDGIGANAKMNEFSAAMGLCNLKHIDRDIEIRKKIVELYNENLENIKGIRINHIQNGIESNYAYYPIIIENDFGADRDEVYDTMKKNGIYVRKYFYPITNSFECYKGKYDIQITPIAYDISRKVLTLPLFPVLSFDNVNRICSILKACKR